MRIWLNTNEDIGINYPALKVTLIDGSSQKECIHDNKKYTRYGKSQIYHGIDWRIRHAFIAFAFTLPTILLLPLAFNSYRQLVVSSWKKTFSGKEKLTIYILKMREADLPNRMFDTSTEVVENEKSIERDEINQDQLEKIVEEKLKTAHAAIQIELDKLHDEFEKLKKNLDCDTSLEQIEIDWTHIKSEKLRIKSEMELIKEDEAHQNLQIQFNELVEIQEIKLGHRDTIIEHQKKVNKIKDLFYQEVLSLPDICLERERKEKVYAPYMNFSFKVKKYCEKRIL